MKIGTKINKIVYITNKIVYITRKKIFFLQDEYII